jgi:hypothetical protein
MRLLHFMVRRFEPSSILCSKLGMLSRSDGIHRPPYCSQIYSAVAHEDRVGHTIHVRNRCSFVAGVGRAGRVAEEAWSNERSIIVPVL